MYIYIYIYIAEVCVIFVIMSRAIDIFAIVAVIIIVMKEPSHAEQYIIINEGLLGVDVTMRSADKSRHGRFPVYSGMSYMSHSDVTWVFISSAGGFMFMGSKGMACQMPR